MQSFKAFVAGLVVPSIILPVLLCIAIGLGKPQILNIAFIHFIPIVWGIWNVLYFAVFKKILKCNLSCRLLLTGAILGLLVATYAVFWLQVPAIIGLPSSLFYLPLIGAPILYAILWRLCVKPLNDLLHLNDY